MPHSFVKNLSFCYNSFMKELFSVGVVSPLMVPRLQEIYDHFSSKFDFPHLYCGSVSDEVAKLGFEKIWGTFRLDYPLPDSPKLTRGHAWCIDYNQTIIDLTATQFNLGLVNPISERILIVTPSSPHFARYSQKTS